MKPMTAAVAAVLLAAAMAAAPAAQRSPAFRGGIDLVSLSVTVTGPGGKYVSDLTAEDFTVLEDGKPQELRFFERAQTPLAVSLLIDSSASMRGELPLAQQAAADFVARLRPGDVAQIVDFDRRVQVLQPFTSDRAALTRAIQRVRPSGSTSMYNAVYIALQELGALATPSPDQIRRDVIIVLSDGEDTTSLVSFDSLLDSAKRSRSVIYTIGLGSTGAAMRSREADPEFALRALAQETGGRLFLTRTGAALPDIYGQIADELSSQYVVGYVSSNTQPTGWRRIAVRVDRPGTQARTRTGYYAGKSALTR